MTKRFAPRVRPSQDFDPDDVDPSDESISWIATARSAAQGKIKCPACGHRLTVADAVYGHTCRCSWCDEPIVGTLANHQCS